MASSINPRVRNFSQVRWTCSTHGENEQSRPPANLNNEQYLKNSWLVRNSVKIYIAKKTLPELFIPSTACETASQGWGKSRNTASALWATSRPNPFSQTSRCATVTKSFSPCDSNSFLATSDLCSWKSNVYKCPLGLIALIRAWESEPLPVPYKWV